MKTTLNQIREHSPCGPGWEKLLRSLNKTKADDEPISIVQIIDSNGLDDALWCLRAVDGRDREIRHYMVWCARQVQHLMTDPRSVNALDVAERFADGLATQDELAAAWDVARAASARASAGAVAASAAARASAVAVAWATAAKAAKAVRDTAKAARDAGDAAAKDAQEKKLRELCAWCDENPIAAMTEQDKNERVTQIRGRYSIVSNRPCPVVRTDCDV